MSTVTYGQKTTPTIDQAIKKWLESFQKTGSCETAPMQYPRIAKFLSIIELNFEQSIETILVKFALLWAKLLTVQVY